jgi:asparagine synthase (glutamine-hydrolysing)
MCGIAGIFGRDWNRGQLEAMTTAQRHRGPDDTGWFIDESGLAGLGHNRLSIIDLTAAGHQPMSNRDGSLWITFNGEIYNYLELRQDLADYPFRTKSDTEVILAAYERYGEACLDRFLGMWSFAIWDSRKRTLFAARDRFGVKPLFFSKRRNGDLWIASEIQAFHAAGIALDADEATWATYLAFGLHDHTDSTFWQEAHSLPPGYLLRWEDGKTETKCWYDLAERCGPELDGRPASVVQEEYTALLADSIRLRFRSDVEVGINISGGLDSSALLALVHNFNPDALAVKAFTYVTGDEKYDELPWVKRTLANLPLKSFVYQLRPEEIPDLAASVQACESEPFGGFPTLAYARLFELAKQEGVTVLLDGQGMDEQWAGYDYYSRLTTNTKVAPLQGTTQRAVMPECLTPEFLAKAIPFEPPVGFEDPLRNRQYLDARYTKIPRALRFNDRVSMRASAELREPFMDHRLFELALRQPVERKISNGVHKWMLREITGKLLPCDVIEAPKRPVQTPQREWLAGSLRGWASECVQTVSERYRGIWFKENSLVESWEEWTQKGASNSYFVWQWVSLGLSLQNSPERIFSSK